MKEYYNYLQELFEKMEWPKTSSEEWRRSDVSGMGLEEYTTTGNESFSSDSFFPGLDGSIKNGVLVTQGFLAELKKTDENLTMHYSSTSRRDLSGTENLSGLDKIDLLHILQNTKTLFIESARNIIHPEPVIAEYRFSGNRIVFAPRIGIRAGSSSVLDLVLKFDHDDTESLIVADIDIAAENNAEVRVGIINAGGISSRLFFNISVHAAGDSRVRFNEFHAAGSFVKSRLTGDLDGAGSELRLGGAYIVSENCHYDLCTYQNHNTDHAFSDSLYKGVVAEHGYSVFQGLINVNDSANGTDAYLSNKNILLADGARADSIPKLNIRTNDVKCSHGSTSGKLDRNQIFYLQSRGYSSDEAKRMILKGFFSEIIDNYPEIVKNGLEVITDKKLAGE